jgi:hypothetical protein
MLNIEPVWSALVLTSVLLLTTIYARRFMSAAWANPLDILTLAFAAQTVLLEAFMGVYQGHVVLLALLLAFACITYTMALYQRRAPLFVLTLVFAFLACFPLSDTGLTIGQAQDTSQRLQGAAPVATPQGPTVLFVLCVILPFVWAGLGRFFQSYRWFTEKRYALIGSFWTSPVLIISLLYTLEFLGLEVYRSVSTLELWLQIPFPIALEMALLSYIWYSTAVVAREKVGLVVASGLGCLALALYFPTSSSLVLAAIAFGGILLAVPISRLVGRDWGGPLYIVGLLAAFLLARSGQLYNTLAFTSWALLSFGVLIYLLSLIERESWLAAGLRWLAIVFVTWSVYDASLLGQYMWAPMIAVLGAVIGVGVRMIVPLVTPTLVDRNRLWSYVGPLYTISLVSALLMGLDGLLLGIARPFYGAIPYALLTYAVVVYGVLLLEKYPQGLFLTAGFAIWGLLLTVQMPMIYCVTIGIALGLVGLGCGRILKLVSIQRVAHVLVTNVEWNWPWYLTFLVAVVLTGTWNLFPLKGADGIFLENGLLAFAVLAYIIVLVEEMPLWLGWICAGLAGWSLIEDGLSPQTGLLAQSGVFTLGIGAVLLYCLARLLPSPENKMRRYACYYGAGLLLSLTISWELLSFGQNPDISWLTLGPASYMIITSPFLLQDRQSSQFRWIGHGLALCGALLLLLPTLWSSFGQGNVLPTLLLSAEALLLLLLGVGVRIRFFVLSGAALFVVGAIRLLFLPALGIPTFLALTLSGIFLLAVATALLVIRTRLALIWSELS